MAELLLTHSYVLRHDPKEFKAMMPYPPLGTLYAATYLRLRGYETALFDSMLASDESEITRSIDEHKPSTVIIYDDDFNYLTKMCLSRMRRAAFTMSRIARERGCTVIVHGSDPADHVEDYLQHGADYVVFGEGEITLGELLDHLHQGKGDLAAIEGVAYARDGQVFRNRHRPVLPDLDQIEFPRRDLVDMNRYRSIWKARHGYYSTYIVTTRGCPFHCNWCAKPIYGQVYHSRSPGHVVEEMLYLKKDFGPDHLWFCDDIFGLKPGWVPAFAEAVVTHKATIPFKCLSRADLLLNENTIDHLVRAGCRTVWIGAESGSQKILDAMEKGTTIEQIYASSALLHSRGIRIGFFLQYGYPGETRADIDRTFTMLRDCKPEEIGVSVSYPLPGTKFYEAVKSKLGSKRNWVDSEDLDLMYRGSYCTDFYRTLHRVTHKKFRLWQGVDLFKTTCLHPSSVSATTLRAMAASAYHAVTLPRLIVKLDRLSGEPPYSMEHP